jgi:soluble lytic murein transglycosylase-like protein
MKPSERFRSLADYWAWRAELPPDLVWRQIGAESSYNPRAMSPAGAKGLLQLMPGTAAEVNVADPFNPDDCLRGGCEYLAKQLANVKITVGSQPVVQEDLLRFALVSYNAGGAYVRAALRDLLARGLPCTWANFTTALPTASVRGRRANTKECLPYALKILPLGDA